MPHSVIFSYPNSILKLCMYVLTLHCKSHFRVDQSNFNKYPPSILRTSLLSPSGSPATKTSTSHNQYSQYPHHLSTPLDIRQPQFDSPSSTSTLLLATFHNLHVSYTLHIVYLSFHLVQPQSNYITVHPSVHCPISAHNQQQQRQQQRTTAVQHHFTTINRSTINISVQVLHIIIAPFGAHFSAFS